MTPETIMSHAVRLSLLICYPLKPFISVPLLVLLVFLQGCDSSNTNDESISHIAPAINEFVGSDACGQCHQTEFSLWSGSHHQLAMSRATEQSVLGDFNNVKITFKDRVAHFFKSENLFFVTTDNAEGEAQTFEITDTFGVEPLQQYLVKFPRGRKQVLDIAWDSRDQSLGGQTWFFIHSDHGKNIINKEKTGNKSPLDHIKAPQANLDSNDQDSSEPLHWTSSFYNWNSRCASCHTTGFEKKYDTTSDSYKSEYIEDKVGCESCHGKGKQHIQWAKGDTERIIHHQGFNHSIKDTGVWDVINEISQSPLAINEPIRESKDSIQSTGTNNNHKDQNTLYRAPATKIRTGLSAKSQVEACAGCHSRRLQLSEHQAGKPFIDNYMPMLIEQPLYHNDGQIKDEVFVWGSFSQSKMFQAGVVCSNCHNAHSLQLKIQGNSLCTQCHSPSVYDNTEHHQHLSSSSGAQCVNCHMPDTPYMNIDNRRDHSFKIPRPSISKQTGSPDACTQCHTQKTQEWATENITRLFGHNLKPHVYASVFSKSQTATHKQTNQLLHIANNSTLPNIIRASALTHIGANHSQSSVQALKVALKNESDLIRLGAVRSLNTLPINLRFDLLKANLSDPSKSVQVEMARQLAPLDLSQFNNTTVSKINRLYKSLVSAALYDADTPESQVTLANFYSAQKKTNQAISHYKKALLLEPYFENALLNLADVYRGIGKDSEALSLLKEATTHNSQSPHGHYALGLLYIRQKDLPHAIKNFQQVIKIAPNNLSYTYTYLLALIKNKQTKKAEETINQWQLIHGQEDMIETLRKSL